MAKHKPKIISQKDWVAVSSPPLTAAQLRKLRPASEVLPELFAAKTAQALLKPRGRPPAASVKERITIRLDPDVLAAFRATGQGWQTRINEAMREWMKAHTIRRG